MISRPVFHLFSILAIAGVIPAAFAQTAIMANPDYFSSGISWTTEGVPGIKIGDILRFHYFDIGAMFEARNEKRFNQEIFPNHNWRCTGRIEIPFSLRPPGSSHFSFNALISHESAHPTMGIREPTQKAFELIYDDVYRRMILNSIGVAGRFSCSCPHNHFSAGLGCYFYFLSKNTPELAGSKLGLSNGLSIGAENRYAFNRSLDFFVSIYDRIIFRSSDSDSGLLHEGNYNNLTNVGHKYPVMTQVNTIVLKAGLVISCKEHMEIVPYCRLLYGNSYGFIDSRDNRLALSFGIEATM
jgi:hypothetical protein